MKRIIVVLVALLIAIPGFGLTWTHYTDMTKTAGGVPVSISTGAVDAFLLGNYFFICGTGDTITANANRSLYLVPKDLSGETIDKPLKLPYPGQEFTKMFNYGDRLYWFGGREPIVKGSRNYPEVYSAIITGSSVGTFAKVTDIPFYSTHSQSQYYIAQSDVDNSYYIMGGTCWGNIQNVETSSLDYYNGSLYYSFSGTDRYELLSVGGGFDFTGYGKLTTDGEFSTYMRTLTLNPWVVMAYGSSIAPVSTGAIIVNSIGVTRLANVYNKGYVIAKVDANGSTTSVTTYDAGTAYTQISAAITYEDYVYFCGYVNSKLTVGKINSSGTQIWAKDLGYAPSFDGLRDLQIADDYIYTVGESNGLFVAKLDLDGNTLAVVHNNLPVTSEYVQDVTVTADSVYTSASTGTGIESVVIAYDLDLNFKWSYTVPGWGQVPGAIYIKDANTIGIYGTDGANYGLVQLDTSGNCINATALPYMIPVNLVHDGTNFYGPAIGKGEFLKVDADGNSLWTFGSQHISFDGSAVASDNVSYLKLSGTAVVDSWSTTLPFKVFDAYTVAYDGYLYVFGGNTYQGSSTTNCWSAPINIDGTLGVWSAITALPVQGGRGDITRMGNTVYIASGLSPVGTTNEFVGILSGGTVSWSGPTASFPYIQKYTSLVNDGSSVFSIGGWSGVYGQNPMDDIYVSEINSPTVTPTFTITRTHTLTPQYTATKTPTITQTATIAPTMTRTPQDIYHHNTDDSDHGVVLMNDVNGTTILSLAKTDPYFIKGDWGAKVSRDVVYPSTYLLVSRTAGDLIIKITNQDNSPYDCSTNSCNLYWNVWKRP